MTPCTGKKLVRVRSSMGLRELRNEIEGFVCFVESPAAEGDARFLPTMQTRLQVMAKTLLQRIF
jgi:hypothetical protein